MKSFIIKPVGQYIMIIGIVINSIKGLDRSIERSSQIWPGIS